MAMEAPEMTKCASHAELNLRFTEISKKLECRTDVVVLKFESSKPHDLFVALCRMRLRLLRQRPEELGMSASELLRLPGLLEHLQCELPDRLQHGEAL